MQLGIRLHDIEQLAKIQQSYYANIRFAAQLGAGVVGTETGAPNTTYEEDTPEGRITFR